MSFFCILCLCFICFQVYELYILQNRFAVTAPSPASVPTSACTLYNIYIYRQYHVTGDTVSQVGQQEDAKGDTVYLGQNSRGRSRNPLSTWVKTSKQLGLCQLRLTMSNGLNNDCKRHLRRSRHTALWRILAALGLLRNYVKSHPRS